MAKNNGEDIDLEAQNKDIAEQIGGANAKTEHQVTCLYEIPDPLPPLMELYDFGKKKVSSTGQPETEKQGKRKCYEEHGCCELPAPALKKRGKEVTNDDAGGLPDIVEPLPENLDQLWEDHWTLENFFDNVPEF